MTTRTVSALARYLKEQAELRARQLEAEIELLRKENEVLRANQNA